MGDITPAGSTSITRTAIEISVSRSSPTVQAEPEGRADTSPRAVIDNLSRSISRTREALQCGEDPQEVVRTFSRDLDNCLANLPQKQNGSPQAHRGQSPMPVYCKYGDPYLPRRIARPGERQQSPTTYWDETPRLFEPWAPEATSTPDQYNFCFEDLVNRTDELYREHDEYRPIEQETIPPWCMDAQHDISSEADPTSPGSLERGWRARRMPSHLLTEEELEERRIRREQRTTFDSTPSSTGYFSSLDFSLTPPQLTPYTEGVNRFKDQERQNCPEPSSYATHSPKPRTPSPQRVPEQESYRSPSASPQRTSSQVPHSSPCAVPPTAPSASTRRTPCASSHETHSQSPHRTRSKGSHKIRSQGVHRTPSKRSTGAPPPSQYATQSTPSNPVSMRTTKRVLVSSTNLHRDLSTSERGDDLDVGIEILRVMEMKGVLHDDYMTDEEVTKFLKVPPRPERTWESISPTLRSPSPVQPWTPPPPLPDEPLPYFVPPRSPEPSSPEYVSHFDRLSREEQEEVEREVARIMPKYKWVDGRYVMERPKPQPPLTRFQKIMARLPRRKITPPPPLTREEEEEIDRQVAEIMRKSKNKLDPFGPRMASPPCAPGPPPPTPVAKTSYKQVERPPEQTQRRRMSSLGIMRSDQMAELEGYEDEENFSQFMCTPEREPPGFSGRMSSFGVLREDQMTDFESCVDEDQLSQFLTTPSQTFEGGDTEYLRYDDPAFPDSEWIPSSTEDSYLPIHPSLPTGIRPDYEDRRREVYVMPPGFTMDDRELEAQRKMFESIERRNQQECYADQAQLEEFMRRNLPDRHPPPPPVQQERSPFQEYAEDSPTQYPPWASSFYRGQQPTTSTAHWTGQLGKPPSPVRRPTPSPPSYQSPCPPQTPRPCPPVAGTRPSSSPYPQWPPPSLRDTPIPAEATPDADDEWESESPSPPKGRSTSIPRKKSKSQTRFRPGRTRSAMMVLPSRARTDKEIARLEAAAAAAAVAPTPSTASATISLECTPSGRVKKTVRFSEEISLREIPSREDIKRLELSDTLSRYGTTLKPPRTASTYRPPKSEYDQPPEPKKPMRVSLQEPVYGPYLPFEYGSCRPPPRTAAGKLPCAYQSRTTSPGGTPPQRQVTASRRPLSTSISPRSASRSPGPSTNFSSQQRDPRATCSPSTTQPRSFQSPLATSTPLQRGARSTSSPQQRSFQSPLATSTPLQRGARSTSSPQQRCFQSPLATSTPQQRAVRSTSTPKQPPLSTPSPQQRSLPKPLATSTPMSPRQPSSQRQKPSPKPPSRGRPPSPPPDATRSEVFFNERTRILHERLLATNERIRRIECEFFSPVRNISSSPSSGTNVSPAAEEFLEGFMKMRKGVKKLQCIVQNRLEKGNRQKMLNQFTLR